MVQRLGYAWRSRLKGPFNIKMRLEASRGDQHGASFTAAGGSVIAPRNVEPLSRGSSHGTTYN